MASDINTEHFDGRLSKTEIAGIAAVVSMALLAAVNYESNRRKVCGESAAAADAAMLAGAVDSEDRVVANPPETPDS